MKGPPLPLPTLLLPLPSRRGGAGRLSVSHSFSFVRRQASPHPAPPDSLRCNARTLPPLSALRPTLDPSPGRTRPCAGVRTRLQLPGEGHPPVRARRAPAPAPRPRSRSRRCPRRRRPALASLAKLQAHVSPGAGRGRQWGGGGGERSGDPRTLGQPGRRDSSAGVVPGRPGLPRWTVGPPGAPRRFAFKKALQREGRPRLRLGNPCCF